MSTKNWEKRTRTFIGQFFGCDDAETCEGCKADLDGIIEHIESLLSEQREEMREKIQYLRKLGKHDIKSNLTYDQGWNAALDYMQDSLQDPTT